MPDIFVLALVRGSPRTRANQKKWGIFKCPFRGILLRHQHGDVIFVWIDPSAWEDQRSSGENHASRPLDHQMFGCAFPIFSKKNERCGGNRRRIIEWDHRSNSVPARLIPNSVDRDSEGVAWSALS